MVHTCPSNPHMPYIHSSYLLHRGRAGIFRARLFIDHNPHLAHTTTKRRTWIELSTDAASSPPSAKRSAWFNVATASLSFVSPLSVALLFWATMLEAEPSTLASDATHATNRNASVDPMDMRWWATEQFSYVPNTETNLTYNVQIDLALAYLSLT